MSFIIITLVVLAICVLLFIAAIAIVFLGLRRIWRRTQPNQVVLRSVIIACGLGAVALPYVAIKVSERNNLLARVPEPLEVAEIEYRLEESWGLGFMPGDNETGFVVYRLTNDSAGWARKQGSRLGDMLSGESGTWHETPVDDRSDQAAISQWHPYDSDPEMMAMERLQRHPPTIFEYLEKYGFIISIEKGRDHEADRAIQSSGSFYSYGKGGSVTIVDPARGKVYFAYAG
ncbi:hypothetical protein [Rhizobium sophoriradicis]|uniref:Uncharacterized protein n=1 Tax=Rhizobium sophoriradicis TaxID=1535245 RepID=A0A2A5KTP7_9HYPH|nr:hypothetical protein [Rhizobium sophoriradicis]PCK80341.1 hypothetical protein CPT34_13830 [Rhizobium sophoriradicis]UWU37807.1 hypothetical protein N2597_27735 [Rhizobium leguminosarum bv. phaseoli]